MESLGIILNNSYWWTNTLILDYWTWLVSSWDTSKACHASLVVLQDVVIIHSLLLNRQYMVFIALTFIESNFLSPYSILGFGISIPSLILIGLWGLFSLDNYKT